MLLSSEAYQGAVQCTAATLQAQQGAGPMCDGLLLLQYCPRLALHVSECSPSADKPSPCLLCVI